MYNTIYETVTDKNGQQVLKHVQEVFDVLGKWFNKLEDGTHVLAIPDPFENSIDLERADHLINEIDRDFEENENWRIIQGKYDFLPQFGRLCDNAKIAMVQEILALLQHQKEHPEAYISGAIEQ